DETVRRLSAAATLGRRACDSDRTATRARTRPAARPRRGVAVPDSASSALGALDPDTESRVVVPAGKGLVLVVRDRPPALEDRAIGPRVRVHAEVDVAADDRRVRVRAAVPAACDPAEGELLLLELGHERLLPRPEIRRLGRLVDAARA